MSFKVLRMTDVEKITFLPQAIIGQAVERLSRHLSVDFTPGHDDFDSYVGAAFALNGNVPFRIMHYQGHPRDTVTLYLPHDIRDVPKITSLVTDILAELKLSPDALIWQRSDDPDL